MWEENAHKQNDPLSAENGHVGSVKMGNDLVN